MNDSYLEYLALSGVEFFAFYHLGIGGTFRIKLTRTNESKGRYKNRLQILKKPNIFCNILLTCTHSIDDVPLIISSMVVSE